jgi:arylsulfatase A-like enzyme
VKANGGDLDAMRESEERVSADFHQTTWATERALEFLTETESIDKPWMLNINPYDPHPPFIPPKEYADKFDPETMPGPYFRDSDLAAQEKLGPVDFQTEAQTPEERGAKKIQALYYAMIALIDDQLARIIQRLDETGQRENTIIIFTSDHGESLGDHGLLLKGCRFYDGLVRVPLIFNCPGTIESGVRSEALVELLDMSATILDFAGIERPDYFQGDTLRPILSGEATPDHHRESVRSEYFDALDKAFCRGNASFATMYRTRRYKLVVYHRNNLGELFDLEKDPHEFENLWDDSATTEIKNQLILESFNDHVMKTTDVGSRRIAPM